MKTHTYLSSDLKEIGKITRGQSFHHEGESKYKGKTKRSMWRSQWEQEIRDVTDGIWEDGEVGVLHIGSCIDNGKDFRFSFWGGKPVEYSFWHESLRLQHEE